MSFLCCFNISVFLVSSISFYPIRRSAYICATRLHTNFTPIHSPTDNNSIASVGSSRHRRFTTAFCTFPENLSSFPRAQITPTSPSRSPRPIYPPRSNPRNAVHPGRSLSPFLVVFQEVFCGLAHRSCLRSPPGTPVSLAAVRGLVLYSSSTFAFPLSVSQGLHPLSRPSARPSTFYQMDDISFPRHCYADFVAASFFGSWNFLTSASRTHNSIVAFPRFSHTQLPFRSSTFITPLNSTFNVLPLYISLCFFVSFGRTLEVVPVPSLRSPPSLCS